MNEQPGEGAGVPLAYIEGQRKRPRKGKTTIQQELVECYKCHKLGHFQYECLDWERGAYYAELEEEEEMLLMDHVELKNATRDEVWFLDSGCSNRMIDNKLWFISFDEGFRQLVKLGNNFRMGVMGRGNIRMDVEGVTQIITQVYYIPELKNNL